MSFSMAMLLLKVLRHIRYQSDLLIDLADLVLKERKDKALGFNVVVVNC